MWTGCRCSSKPEPSWGLGWFHLIQRRLASACRVSRKLKNVRVKQRKLSLLGHQGEECVRKPGDDQGQSPEIPVFRMVQPAGIQGEKGGSGEVFNQKAIGRVYLVTEPVFEAFADRGFPPAGKGRIRLFDQKKPQEAFVLVEKTKKTKQQDGVVWIFFPSDRGQEVINQSGRMQVQEKPVVNILFEFLQASVVKIEG